MLVTMGRRQVVRHLVLVQAFGGSNPSVPDIFLIQGVRVMKKILCLLVIIIMSCGFAMAKDNYGFIDVNYIMSKYSVAVNFTSNVKQRENEIQRLLNDANKKMKATTDAAAKKNIEAAAKKQIQPKLDALVSYQKQQNTKIQNNINAAITKVANANNYALILNGNSVVYGATNVSELVLRELNANFK